MLKAVWGNAVLAESKDIVEVEGNSYFPPESLLKEYFMPSETTTVCPWKGTASHYHLKVDGKENRDAAWFIPIRRMLRNRSKAAWLSGGVSEFCEP